MRTLCIEFKEDSHNFEGEAFVYSEKVDGIKENYVYALVIEPEFVQKIKSVLENKWLKNISQVRVLRKYLNDLL